MANEKHKGTEYANIKRVREQNEKQEPRGTEIHESGNAFSNVNDAWEENEKEAAKREMGETERDEP